MTNKTVIGNMAEVTKKFLRFVLMTHDENQDTKSPNSASSGFFFTDFQWTRKLHNPNKRIAKNQCLNIDATNTRLTNLGMIIVNMVGKTKM